MQYFLIDSLPADTLATHERALVDYYVERRAHYGTAIDPGKTWQEYRSFAFHTLMTIVVSIGFGALNEEQDDLMVEIFKRSVAAIQRVDYAGWFSTTTVYLSRRASKLTEAEQSAASCLKWPFTKLVKPDNSAIAHEICYTCGPEFTRPAVPMDARRYFLDVQKSDKTTGSCCYRGHWRRGSDGND